MSVYMSVVINAATPNRLIDIKKIVENAKNMFRDGVRYHDDLWLQHCAASIREILMFIEPSHFFSAYQNIKPGTDADVDRILSFIINSKAYLSSIVHFRNESKVGQADTLYLGQGYAQKSEADFLSEENLFFEKVCIDLVYTLHHLFTTYCVGASNT